MRNQTRESGIGTIEVVIALSLFSATLLSLGGLALLSLASGTAAETTSIAMNLARARMEVLRSIPAPAIVRENGTTSVERVPAGQGRPYTVHTTVESSNSDLLDVTVTVTWQVAYGSTCAAEGTRAGCKGKVLTRTQTLKTRLRGPDSP